MGDQQDKWQRLEASLSGLFGSAKARADGYELSFHKQRDGEKLVVQVFVNDYIKGVWSSAKDGEPEHPEARFWRPLRARVWKIRQHGVLKKLYGKKKADEMTAMRTVSFSPFWNSPRTLVRHLKKHFPDMELLEPGDHSER